MTTTLSFPAVAVEVTTTEQVNVVPEDDELHELTAACESADVAVPLKAATVLMALKPVPVMVRVSGVVPEVPTTMGALGLNATAVMVGTVSVATPTPKSLAPEIAASLPPLATVGF